MILIYLWIDNTDTLIYFNLVKKKRLALLDLLIAASQDGLLTDLDIREEIDVFMFGVRIYNFLNFLLLNYSNIYIDVYNVIIGSWYFSVGYKLLVITIGWA